MQVNTKKSEEIVKPKSNFFDKLLNLAMFKFKAEEVQQDQQEEEIKQLLESIDKTKREWTRASMNFEYAESREAVDYYTYTIKANEVMYEHLIRQAKEKGIRIERQELIANCKRNIM